MGNWGKDGRPCRGKSNLVVALLEERVAAIDKLAIALVSENAL